MMELRENGSLVNSRREGECFCQMERGLESLLGVDFTLNGSEPSRY